MSEPVTEDDDALRGYAQYRKRHAEDLARRGPAPHATTERPQDGYLKILSGALLRFQDGDWSEVAKMPKPTSKAYGLDKCVLSGNAIYCFEGYYWKISGLVGLTAAKDQSEAYCAVEAEPWPQGVWDEDKLTGVAASREDSDAYYNYPKSQLSTPVGAIQ
jgi:hypothetical protein